ncbi:MAG TPA: hypothetical protein EYQ46_21360 [Myxococcales bacterium]|nr:hypothetical protein [Myxococcales bacterium]HIL81081.1 hypothetical protein [Myxococcales bacterium]
MVLHLDALLPFLETVNAKWRTATLEEIASLWVIHNTVVHDAVELAEGHRTTLLLHPFSASQIEFGRSTLDQLGRALLGKLNLDGDEAIFRRYQAYAALPEGTVGRTAIDYYEDNEFPLPGTKGATFSNSLTHHDLHHVIAGYDTGRLR